MPELTQIILYPIKSLDGVTVPQAIVLASGALQHDREFAIVDLQGKFVNGKRTADVYRIRSYIDLSAWTVRLQIQEQTQAMTFHLDHDRVALEEWLSAYFGFAVKLIQETQVGFPDDTDSPGPTVISTGTLQAIADWFPNLSLEETRRRFRSNLEISGVEPFWEDRLFGEHDRTIPFQIGDVELAGVNPCQRCVVVTRDATTGESLPSFKIFSTKRRETLPTWTEPSRFNHFFRLAVNTRTLTPQAGKILRVGDQVMLDEA